MRKNPLTLLFVLVVFIAGVGLCGSAPDAPEPTLPAGKKLIVHEWGVLGVGLHGGSQVVGSTDRYLESLPDYVLRNEEESPTTIIERRLMDSTITIYKPVVHFYGKEGQKIEFTIKVGTGYPIVYYPKPALGVTTREVPGAGKLTQAQTMTWKFGLSKKAPADLVAPPEGHWWNAARKIPSDYVIMDDGSAGNDRFVFYEGTTYKSPTVTAKVSEKVIEVKNSYTAASAPIILIINDNESHSGIYIDSIAAGATVSIPKDKLQLWDEEQVFENCRQQWLACGMTPEEAAGIVECWREELVEKPGFLLISRIPEAIYEEIFPLTMSPKPTELKRACLVYDTLAGQDGRKHWLPSIRKEAEGIITALADEGFRERMAARGQLIGMGEIVMPFVNELLLDSKSDAQSRVAASNIRRILNESQVCLPELYPESAQGIPTPGIPVIPFEHIRPIPEIDPLLFPEIGLPKK